MVEKWIKNALYFGILLFVFAILFQTDGCPFVYAAEYDAGIIAKVQDALNNLGYDCGTADGIEGSQTQEAIEQYQANHDLNVNGTIDDELLSSLGILDNDTNEITETLGVPVTTFVERYGDYISDYNMVALFYDMDYANSITEEQVLAEDILSPDNDMEIVLNYESEGQKDYIGEFTAWGGESADLSSAELNALIYALDTSLEDTGEAAKICNEVLDALEMEYNGISYSVIAASGFITFTAKINGYEPKKEEDLEVELPEDNETEEPQFVAGGNTGLFTFLSNAIDNGISITNPHNSAGDVSAEAKEDDEVHSIEYKVKDQHVFEVDIYLENNESTDSESFKSCIIGLAKALNPDIDNNVLKTSIEETIEKPDEQVIASDTLFIYSSNEGKFVIKY